MTTLFISGIDTDIGKTVACGALAKTILDQGYKLFTQKWVETGAKDVSLDLLTHESIVSRRFNTHDLNHHSPYRFTFPASPHLSAKLENKEIDIDYIFEQTKRLSKNCEHLLIEGAGGLCVPLNAENVIIDLVAQLELPLLLVTSGRLGSINHTILSLELCWQRNINVRAIIYNQYPMQDEIITNNTRQYLQNYLRKQNKDTLWLELLNDSPSISLDSTQLQKLLK